MHACVIRTDERQDLRGSRPCRGRSGRVISSYLQVVEKSPATSAGNVPPNDRARSVVPKVVQHVRKLPTSADKLPGEQRFRPKLANVWPSSAGWPMSSRIGRHGPSLATCLSRLGRCLAEFGQVWPNIGPTWPHIRPILAHTGQFCLTSAKLVPNQAKCGQKLANFGWNLGSRGKCSTTVGQCLTTA